MQKRIKEKMTAVVCLIFSETEGGISMRIKNNMSSCLYFKVK